MISAAKMWSLLRIIVFTSACLCILIPGDAIAGNGGKASTPKSTLHFKTDTILYSDNFDTLSSDWIAEFEKPASSSLKSVSGLLDVSTSAGATIWFNHKLSGDILITYNVIVLDSAGIHDRVSDLNAFWMASDPATNKLPVRNGKFSSYDNLNLYYAGVGGNNNSTTRFRKYANDGDKPVIQEYLDKSHLLAGNTMYEVKIVVMDSRVQYYLNNELFFDYSDGTPYREGYFGFRTTCSHQQFRDFKVYRIKNNG